MVGAFDGSFGDFGIREMLMFSLLKDQFLPLSYGPRRNAHAGFEERYLKILRARK